MVTDQSLGLREWLASIIHERMEELDMRAPDLALRLGYGEANNVRLVLKCRKDIPLKRVHDWHDALEIEPAMSDIFLTVAACSRLRGPWVPRLIRRLVRSARKGQELLDEVRLLEQERDVLREHFNELQREIARHVGARDSGTMKGRRE